MTQLPIEDGITRFKGNEERVDIFVNDPLSTGYYTTNETVPRQVKTLPTLVDEILDSTVLRSDVTDTANAAKGDALIGVKQPFTGAVARTQHDKNAEWVSVLDFGAVGDSDAAGNGTDDTAAILAAIASLATTGGIIYFPPGRYKITSMLTLGKGVHLVGSGQAHVDVLHSVYTRSRPSTILKYGAIDAVTTDDGCSLQNISVEGAYDRTNRIFLNTGNGIILIGQNARLVDVSVCMHNGNGIIIGARTLFTDTNFWNLTRVLSIGNNLCGFLFDNTSPLYPTLTNNNAGHCSGCYAWMNGGDGFYIKSTYGNTFTECYSEENGNLLQLGVSTPAHGYHVGGSLALFNTFMGCSGELNTTSLFTMDVGSFNNSVIGSVYGYQPIDNGHNSWMVCQGGESNLPGMSIKGMLRVGRNSAKTSGPGTIGGEIESMNGVGVHGMRPGFYWLDLRDITPVGCKFFEAYANQGVLYFSQYNDSTASRYYWMSVQAAAARTRPKVKVSHPGTHVDFYLPDLENYATNAAAISAGLGVGQIYRNGGAVMVVI